MNEIIIRMLEDIKSTVETAIVQLKGTSGYNQQTLEFVEEPEQPKEKKPSQMGFVDPHNIKDRYRCKIDVINKYMQDLGIVPFKYGKHHRVFVTVQEADKLVSVLDNILPHTPRMYYHNCRK